MSIAIYNSRSSIAREFVMMLPPWETAEADPTTHDHERYLFCTGFLAGKALAEQSKLEVSSAWVENFARVATSCDIIFDRNPEARVCIIGSESGYAGSHDMAYAAAKAGLHLYVERKRLTSPGQQLVAIAPAIVWDSGMTQRRSDLALCETRGSERRRGHWLFAGEIARIAVFALYGDQGGALCNTVIRATGGNW